jgi:signal transduction histidine kinase
MSNLKKQFQKYGTWLAAIIVFCFIPYTILVIYNVNNYRKYIEINAEAIITLNNTEQFLIELSNSGFQHTGSLSSQCGELKIELESIKKKINNPTITSQLDSILTGIEDIKYIDKLLNPILFTNELISISKRVQHTLRSNSAQISLQLNTYWFKLYTLLIISCLLAISFFILSLFMSKEIIRRKKLENELTDKNKSLDAFVYKVSHDIKGPLSSIISAVRVSENEEDIISIKENLAEISNKAWFLNDLVNDFLELTKNTKSEIKPEAIRLHNFINDLIKKIELPENIHNVKFFNHIDNSVIFISDKNILTSILLNILINAVKYRDTEKNQTEIDISYSTSKWGSIIIIKDNGIGIDKEHLPKIFEMFFRINKNIPGSGIGLYLVKQSIEHLGGNISIHSESGKGTEIKLFFPNVKK